MKAPLFLIFSGISLLILLTACGKPETPAPLPEPPTQRIDPGTEPATLMANTAPSPTALPLNAPNADVTYVRAVQAADGSWTFRVTVSHPDTGWEDYVDGWDVVLPDGSKLLVRASEPFTRLLAHPHVDEQPFTRRQSGIIIPTDVTEVTVRAHDILDGFGGQEIIVALDKNSGDGFEVSKHE